MVESNEDEIDGQRPLDGEPERLWDDPLPSQRIRLARGGAILLEADGFRVIEPRGLKRSPFHHYESLTHVTTTGRMLLIGTLSGLVLIRGSDFIDSGTDSSVESGPVQAKRALRARLAARPDGAYRLAEMDRLDALGRRGGPAWTTWSVVLLCLLGMVVQLWNPLIQQVGTFIPELVARGELWRAVTSHFLHAMPGLPIHLALNVGGLVVLGHLTERPLGPWRTVILLGLGGLGSVVGIVLYGYPEVLGSSGLVAGLAGGILALELRHPEAIPAQWRLPRRLFIGALLAQVVLDQLFGSVLAGGAHLGGFAGGYAAVWLLGRPVHSPASGPSSVPSSLPSSEAEPYLARDRFVAAAVIVVCVFGLVGGVPLARLEPGALERHAARLLDVPSQAHLALHENTAAWFLATEGEPSSQDLGLAVALADRAVTSTGRMQPDFLDTLAEALFQAGDRIGALLTIEEAIRLMPYEPYFVEQRRRFMGQRDPDDRPPPPGSNRERSLPAEPPPEPLLDPDAPTLVL